MPYRIAQRGEQYCVIKIGDGSSAGCHDTRDDALGQLAALHANELDEIDNDDEMDLPQRRLAQLLMGVLFDMEQVGPS